MARPARMTPVKAVDTSDANGSASRYFAVCLLLAGVAIRAMLSPPAVEHPAELPQLPPIQRHLGFMSDVQLAQIDGLLDLPREFGQLRQVHCAVCRLSAAEVLMSAVRMTLARSSSPGRVLATIGQACDRVALQMMLGVTASRGQWLSNACQQLLTSSRQAQLASAAALLMTAITTNNSSQLRAWDHLHDVCVDVCPSREEPLEGWPGILEAMLGAEPLGRQLLGTEAVPASMRNQLLYFASAKGDSRAVRLLLLLTSASASALQQHSEQSSKPLRRYLARLLSPPSSKHQIKLLRRLRPSLFTHGLTELEAVVEGASARFAFRVSDLVNDTALHVAAYALDEHTVQELLLLGGHPANARDSRGRSALHYASDLTDQLAGLVSVFAEPANGTATVLQMRSSNRLRMAADHQQQTVVDALSDSQRGVLQLLVAFGADVNAHSYQSGSTPLHLAARSGAVAAAEMLISAGATVDARNRRGFTPLMMATMAGHAAMCRLLLDAGAAGGAMDGAGRSAQWYAAAAGSALQPLDAQHLFGVHRSLPLSRGNVLHLHSAASTAASGGWGRDDRDTQLGHFPDLCEFDRISGSAAPHEVEQDYLNAARPVILTQAAESMPAKQKWTRQALLQRLGSSVLRPQKLPVQRLGSSVLALTSLDEYLKQVAHGKHPLPLSWNVPRNDTLWTQLEKDLAWPSALTPAGDHGLASFGLFIGPQRSGTSMHYHRAAWNALLFGRKLWLLTPPALSKFRRHEMALKSFEDGGWLEEARARAIGNSTSTSARKFCIQQEGEVIFVPAGWGHATLNLNESIGVASFFYDQEASGFKPNKMWHSARGIRSIQAAVGISTPSDYDHNGHE